MAFCQNCGLRLNEGTKFCPNCGTPVQIVEMPAAVPVQQEMSPVRGEAPEQVPPAPQPEAYQPPAPQPEAYQPPAPQPAGYQQPSSPFQAPPAQPAGQPPVQGGAVSEAQMKKGMAVLSYFGLLVLIPIFAARKDPFAKYHANQGFVLFIFMMAFSSVATVLNNVLIEINPLLVLLVSGLLLVCYVLYIIFAIIGIVHAARGQTKPLPLIGGIKLIR